MGLQIVRIAQPQRHSSLSTGPERMWRAVMARDSSADGRFVFAVRSTGVYCRPSCPSRHPLRRHVVFYRNPAAASADGFRPCRRCQPEAASLGDPRSEAVVRVARWMKEDVVGNAALDTQSTSDAKLTLATLSARAGLSPFQLTRAFRRLLGVTPRQYADALRMKSLRRKLRKGDSVTAALYDSGFGSSSRLYERAHMQLGMTPAEYRRGGQEMKIDYTIAASPLGRLLVAATERGISAVYLGESEKTLSAELAREYPRAQIRRSDAALKRWTDAILQHLGGVSPRLDLPTDVQATAFQRRVWEELRRIPYGETRTYKQIARLIGRPSAIRAVARACATNPTSIVVPCHRVVRGDGNLAGYRWGVKKKNALLQREAEVAKKKRGQTGCVA